MQQICRICMSSSLTLMDIFAQRICETKTDSSLAQKLMECVRCAIKMDDNLPQKIFHFESAFIFKRKCEQSHKILTFRLREREISTLDQPIILWTPAKIKKKSSEKKKEKFLYIDEVTLALRCLHGSCDPIWVCTLIRVSDHNSKS